MTGRTDTRSVTINRVAMGQQDIVALDQIFGGRIPDGRYWYDARCGAWGAEGGPAAGFTRAGLPLPGPMPPDISAGNTGIFFNGRELHQAERMFLLQTYGMAVPGRYLLNAAGILMTEAGMPIANLSAGFAAPGTGTFSGIGGSGGFDGEGVVFNMPDGSSYTS